MYNGNKVGCEDFFTKTSTFNVKLQRLKNVNTAKYDKKV